MIELAEIEHTPPLLSRPLTLTMSSTSAGEPRVAYSA